jgi:hypothetical protein
LQGGRELLQLQQELRGLLPQPGPGAAGHPSAYPLPAAAEAGDEAAAAVAAVAAAAMAVLGRCLSDNIPGSVAAVSAKVLAAVLEAGVGGCDWLLWQHKVRMVIAGRGAGRSLTGVGNGGGPLGCVCGGGGQGTLVPLWGLSV